MDLNLCTLSGLGDVGQGFRLAFFGGVLPALVATTLRRALAQQELVILPSVYSVFCRISDIERTGVQLRRLAGLAAKK